MRLRTGEAIPISYLVAGDEAIIEGDINIGRAADVERFSVAVSARPRLAPPEAFLAVGEGGRWPNGEIPYCIADNLPNPARVLQAVAHWNAVTHIRLHDAGAFCKILTGPRLLHINFVPGNRCASAIGMQVRNQDIELDPRCSSDNVIHEIGHAVGLWHEQSRLDRDTFVEIIFSNIPSENHHDFDKHLGQVVGPYDFQSIMHYKPFDFAVDPSKPTIVARTPGVIIGNQTGQLTANDIAAVNQMYP
jgi:hypothetical protein